MNQNDRDEYLENQFVNVYTFFFIYLFYYWASTWWFTHITVSFKYTNLRFQYERRNTIIRKCTCGPLYNFSSSWRVSTNDCFTIQLKLLIINNHYDQISRVKFDIVKVKLIFSQLFRFNFYAVVVPSIPPIATLICWLYKMNRTEIKFCNHAWKITFKKFVVCII